MDDLAVHEIIKRILERKKEMPYLVAINGIDGVGKTTLADKISKELQRLNIPVLQVSIDNFAKPRQKNTGNPHVKKESAASWYYNDAWDYDGFMDSVINPVQSGESEICIGRFSWHRDAPIEERISMISKDHIILVDGIFLFHPKLISFWDLKIFLDADLEKVMERGVDRDSNSKEERKLKYQEYRHCYSGGQEIYLAEVNPESIADIVFDFNDPLDPRLK